MLKSFKFRLYPSKSQEKQIAEHLWIAKNLWNELLAYSKNLYQTKGRFPKKSELQSMTKGKGLYSQTQQNVAHKVSDSIFRIFKLRKQNKKYGFPRFKSIDRLKSLYYPQSGFKLGMKLKVTPFGEMSIKQHRKIDRRAKTLTIKRELSGKWFAIFCVETEKKQPKQNDGEAVGIDLGLAKFAVLSDGRVIKNPRHLKQHEKKLAILQQRLSKKKRGSKNRKKAKLKVALIHEKVSNTRADFLHKTSARLVNDYSLIALEKLVSSEMSQQNYGKSIKDAGWNMFANMVAYKAEEAGCNVVFVDPKNTTQECSSCHEIVKKNLSVRIHDCSFCGLVTDRDLNAARNILIRATAGHAGSQACRDEQKSFFNEVRSPRPLGVGVCHINPKTHVRMSDILRTGHTAPGS